VRTTFTNATLFHPNYDITHYISRLETGTLVTALLETYLDTLSIRTTSGFVFFFGSLYTILRVVLCRMNVPKYWAVKVGRKTGIFTSWNECREQVHGYSNAVQKRFRSLEKAEAFLIPDCEKGDCKEPPKYILLELGDLVTFCRKSGPSQKEGSICWFKEYINKSGSCYIYVQLKSGNVIHTDVLLVEDVQAVRNNKGVKLNDLDTLMSILFNNQLKH
jgi:hypothetical protein